MSSMRRAFLLIGRKCFMNSSLSKMLLLGYFGLVPSNVSGNGHHQIGFPGQEFTFLVLLRLGCGHSPDLSVIVPAELPLRIRPIEIRRKQAGGTQSANELLVVVAKNRHELLERPTDLDRSQVDVVGGVWLAVGTPV